MIADAARLTCTDTTPALELIEDDSGGGFYPAGGWSAGSFGGGYLDTYRFAMLSDTSPATAYWFFDLPQAGAYRLALHYPNGSNRAAAVQYRLQTADGLRQFGVDQTTGGDWTEVGAFNLRAGVSSLQISNRISTATVETLVIDDGDFLFLKSGNWISGTASPGYLDDYLYTGCTPSPTASARWTLPVCVPGNYELHVWYNPGSNRSAQARYVVPHSLGVTTRTLDQTVGEEGWHGLISVRLDSGMYEVTLDNAGPAGRVVIADALRLRYCADQGPLPPVVEQYGDAITTPAAGQAIPVRASVWSLSPITSVTAWQVPDSGTTLTAPLFDDGAHGDAGASDGIYGGELPGGAPCNVLRYGIEARNSEGGIARTPELKCLVACEETTSPELRMVFVYSSKTAAIIDAQLAAVRSGNFNAVIPGVRSVADAYYVSSYEPLAAGVEPGFDPLGYMIAKAHETSGGQQRLQVHPLVLVYRVLTSDTPPPGHVLDLHPEWTGQDYDGQEYVGNRLYLDQGIPEVQDYLVAVFMEIVRNYDIDGFNLDLIRYSAQDFGYNPIALSWFHTFTGRSDRPLPTDPQWSEWRRQQVTALVRRMAALIRSEKPQVVLSADVVCSAKPLLPDENNVFYRSVLQDWTGWMSNGYLDLALGMAYREESDPALAAEFDQWQQFLLDHACGRRAAAITGGYINLLQHTLVQLHRVRQSGADVISLFSHATPTSQGVGSETFYAAAKSQLFRTPVEPPVFDWKSQTSTGLVMGTARAADGSPVRMARIRLVPGGEMRTDLCGFFAFFECEPGARQLELLNEDGTVLTSCSLTVTGGQVTRKDVTVGACSVRGEWTGYR